MAQTQLARPYARAAFEYAHEHDVVTAWAESLDALARLVTTEERVATILADPRLPRDQRGEFLIEICGDGLEAGIANLIRLLAENGRLSALVEVAREFERLRADAENRVDAHVQTARELDDDQQKRLADVLARRLKREIRLEQSVHEELIGGVIVRAGDLVIDASVRGRLQRLANRLGH